MSRPQSAWKAISFIIIFTKLWEINRRNISQKVRLGSFQELKIWMEEHSLTYLVKLFPAREKTKWWKTKALNWTPSKTLVSTWIHPESKLEPTKCSRLEITLIITKKSKEFIQLTKDRNLKLFSKEELIRLIGMMMFWTYKAKNNCRLCCQNILWTKHKDWTNLLISKCQIIIGFNQQKLALGLE